MNKFVFPGALILLSAGIFFTYTQTAYTGLQATREVNKAYAKAIANSKILIEKREQAVAAYNSIAPEDQERLEKILPDNVDVVRLIVDVRTLLSRRGITIKNIKTQYDSTLIGKGNEAKANPNAQLVADDGSVVEPAAEDSIEPVTVTVEFQAAYPLFVEVLKDMESSLRTMEVSKIELTPAEDLNKYTFKIEVRTFWLKQKQK